MNRFLWFLLGGQSVNAKGWLRLLGRGSPKSGTALHFCIHCMKSLNHFFFCINSLFDKSPTSRYCCLNSKVCKEKQTCT